MEEILDILEELNLDADPAVCEALADDGVLSSLDLITLIAELNDRFDIRIPAREIRSENFNSAAAILAMVERLKDE